MIDQKKTNPSWPTVKNEINTREHSSKKFLEHLNCNWFDFINMTTNKYINKKNK